MKAIVLMILALLLCVDAVGDRLPRSHKQIDAFRVGNPCPSTGKTEGSCPGYQVDHKEALELGGEDSYLNMQWLTIKQHHEKTLRDNAAARQLK